MTSSEIHSRSRGHLSPTVPRSDYQVFSRYECYDLIVYASFCRNREIPAGRCPAMPRGVPPKPAEKVQFNIRVDGEVLRRFRDYCRRHGLDPQGQIVLFMRRVLDTEFDFQERLWSALKAETP